MSYPTPFVWDATFDVKHDALNTQHQGLFVAIEDCCQDAKNEEKWNTLKGLVVNHFKDEEAAMEAKGLLTPEHKKIHEDFLGVCGGATPETEGFEGLVKGWLVNHINGSDQPGYAGKL